MPTDVLDGVHIAELDAESSKLVFSYIEEMAELVRTRKVNLHEKREDAGSKAMHLAPYTSSTIISKSIAKDKVWVAAAIMGQASMSPEEAEKTVQILGLTEGIAKQVGTKHRGTDKNSREECHPGRRLEIAHTFYGQHTAPRWCRRFSTPRFPPRSSPAIFSG